MCNHLFNVSLSLKERGEKCRDCKAVPVNYWRNKVVSMFKDRKLKFREVRINLPKVAAAKIRGSRGAWRGWFLVGTVLRWKAQLFIEQCQSLEASNWTYLPLKFYYQIRPISFLFWKTIHHLNDVLFIKKIYSDNKTIITLFLQNYFCINTKDNTKVIKFNL